MEDERSFVTLTDQDGDELDFELVDVVPYEGAEYVVLLPYDASAGDEAVILRLVPAQGMDEDDEELHGIDDKALLDAVYREFIKRQS